MNLEIAKSLIARGWAIFPCVANEKRPATWHGFLDATTDEAQIARWFSRPANIGVRTGKSSGVCVIDVDSYKVVAAENLAALEARLGTLPATYSVTTRAGGTHLYFKMPDADLRSYNNQIAVGVDLRAEGGYVVGEGSYVAEDKYGPAGAYTPANDLPIAELPEAWIGAWTALNAAQDALIAKKAAAAAKKAAALAASQPSLV